MGTYSTCCLGKSSNPIFSGGLHLPFRVVVPPKRTYRFRFLVCGGILSWAFQEEPDKTSRYQSANDGKVIDRVHRWVRQGLFSNPLLKFFYLIP